MRVVPSIMNRAMQLPSQGLKQQQMCNSNTRPVIITPSFKGKKLFCTPPKILVSSKYVEDSSIAINVCSTPEISKIVDLYESCAIEPAALKSYSLSPHPQLAPNISYTLKNLLSFSNCEKKCSNHSLYRNGFIYEYVPIIDNFIDNNIDFLLKGEPKLLRTYSKKEISNGKEMEEKKCQNLKNILTVITDPIKRKSLPYEQVANLNDYLVSHIFRPISAKISNDFNEFERTRFELTHFKHISIVYGIYNTLLNDLSVFGNFLNEKILINLISILVESPVPEERKLAERTIEIAMTTYASKKKKILKTLMSKISRCLENEHFYGIENALRLVRLYYGQCNEAPTQKDFLLFRSQIFPLICSNFLNEFEVAFLEISQFFESKNHATSLWCLKYLARHFPVANQKKQKFFLKHIDVLLPSLPPSMLTTVASDMVQILGSAIGSQATDSIVAALMMLMDDGFVGLFRCVPEATTKYLMKPLIEATENWKDLNREMARQILEKFRGLERKAKNKDEYIDSTEIIWEKIKESAAMNFPDVF